MGPISLCTSGMQHSSLVAAAKPKQMVSNHHPLPEALWCCHQGSQMSFCSQGAQAVKLGQVCV